MIDDLIATFIIVFLFSILFFEYGLVKNKNYEVLSEYKNKNYLYNKEKSYLEEKINGRSRAILIYINKSSNTTTYSNLSLDWYIVINGSRVELK